MNLFPMDSDHLERLVNQYLFFPNRTFVAEPTTLGLPYENIWLTTADGVRLHGWFIPNQTAESTLLSLHGNAENISHLLPILKQLFGAGLQIFALDYRGYGRSEGAPSEQGTYQDALAAWRWLHDEIGGATAIYGRSLGGAVGLWLATQAEVSPCAVIVESTFTSGRELAAQIYPIPGLAPALPNIYPSLDRVGRLGAPLLVIHGTRDEVVPFAHGEWLFAAAPHPKTLLSIPGGHHNDVALAGGKDYIDALATFVTQSCGPASRPDER